MKRLLWLGIGIAIGTLVVRKVTRKAQSFTPGGIASSLSESAGGLVESVRSFVDDVRVGMAEREEQIHAAFADGVLYDDQFAELREDPLVDGGAGERFHSGDHKIFRDSEQASLRDSEQASLRDNEQASLRDSEQASRPEEGTLR